MKALFFIKPIAYMTAITLLFSCQKESMVNTDMVNANTILSKAAKAEKKLQEHKLKGEYTAGYYWFEPDIAAGYVYPNPAPDWYPGAATFGHLNMLGKSVAYVNMYATFGPTGLQGVAAPVNMFFEDELNKLGIVVPDEVATIMLDKHGNSIWGRAIGTITITPISDTRVEFSFKAEIIGGTSKFAGASGSLTGNGYSNPQDLADVGIEISDGTIVY